MSKPVIEIKDVLAARKVLDDFDALSIFCVEFTLNGKPYEISQEVLLGFAYTGLTNSCLFTMDFIDDPELDNVV